MALTNRTRVVKSVLLLTGAWLVGVAAVACVQDPKDAPPDKPSVQPKGTDQLKPEYDASGKLQKLEYDRDKDGKVDAWGYMDGARVVRVEVDENGDGKIDRWEYHRAPSPADARNPAATPEGMDRTVERIERATRFDGKVSKTEYFTDGVLSKIEEDTDGDGKIDKWETYSGGSLSLLAIDTQGRGTPDRRLVYRPDGSLDHLEADQNGSGVFTALKQ